MNADVPPPPPAPGVQTEAFVSAETFANALHPTRMPWLASPEEWIFRGHGNATWQLKASAQRSEHPFKAFGIDGDASDWGKGKPLHDRLLARFRDGLDRSGIVIPTPSPRVLPAEENSLSFSSDPLQEAFPLMALAQHHGLPTMLLDWSRRGAIAAYFAAAAAADPNARDRGTHLAVWALRVDPDWYVPHRVMRMRSTDVRVYQAPGGTNPNLRAQAGLFTLHVGPDNPSLDVVLALNRREPMRSTAVLRRLILPVELAGKLLRLLSYEGITGASMFPGADGVVRAMREEAFWKEPDPEVEP